MHLLGCNGGGGDGRVLVVMINLSQKGLSNRINPLAKGVAPAIVLPPYYGRDTGIAKLAGATPISL